jgi:acetoacetyl-CoA synthetase
MLGNPISPVRAGEIQGPGLGMDIESWNDEGEPLTSAKGDLICKSPFPSMPIGFWGDLEQKKYRDTYFSRFEREVWCHGDYIEMTAHGGVIVYGRSDATLNPGGVRIGTAELYRQVETLPFVVDSIASAIKKDGDDLVTLLIKLKPGMTLTDELKKDVKALIRQNLTPRHVPTFIEAVSDIPYTRSGKKVELAMLHALNNQPVKNVTAIANPEVLSEIRMIGQKLTQLS